MPHPTKHIISCEQCGHPYETVRANTKFCSVCRLQKNIEFVGARKAECWMCKQEFIPVERGEDACGNCIYDNPKHGITECAFCGENRPRVVQDVSVCNHCAREPEHRFKFRGSLRRKVQQRQEDPRVDQAA